ncbi:hypothetical protein NEF87_001869 [Candidatus Lokiarchaeum ossiferum]|uniref:MarR family transcriptional regulator n=1 Tax=Candidatus Lokiarchaeum ossiferum TaxID=2951803 RepID=A0ABY6HSY6_9ARCH|nr:hypothetical protein NEF87_001869 [Candidatus Lokiarchaeum sp. B-35]
MRDFELKIVDFMVEDTVINGGNPNTTQVYTYILLHRKLTQQQLSELTGFPKSKISKITSLLVKNKIFTKKTIPGTHTNEYFLIDHPNDLNEIPASIILSGFQTMISFFNSLIEDLRELNADEHPGRDLLLWRINDFSKYAQVCSAIIEENKDESGIEDFQVPAFEEDPSIFTVEFRQKMEAYLTNDVSVGSVILEFSPQVREIEENFHKFLERGVFKKEKPSLEHILAFFISRGKLTQKKLQDLTDFSAGTISQSLKRFLDTKKIDLVKSKDRSTSEKFYSMHSISLTLFSHHLSVYKEMLRYLPEFREIKNEMNAFSNEYLLQDGYYPIYTIVDKIITVFLPRYEKEMLEHEKLLELLGSGY